MTEWKGWDRDLWIMQSIERDAQEISKLILRITEKADLLPKIPEPAVGPCRALRDTEQAFILAGGTLKAIREKYETKINLVAAE